MEPILTGIAAIAAAKAAEKAFKYGKKKVKKKYGKQLDKSKQSAKKKVNDLRSSADRNIITPLKQKSQSAVNTARTLVTKPFRKK